MLNAKASRRRTRLLLENKKQNMVVCENKLESMKVPWKHKKKMVWNLLESKETKSLNFIDWIIIKKTFIDLKAYLRIP